jgi:hypothetical protein
MVCSGIHPVFLPPPVGAVVPENMLSSPPIRKAQKHGHSSRSLPVSHPHFNRTTRLTGLPSKAGPSTGSCSCSLDNTSVPARPGQFRTHGESREPLQMNRMAEIDAVT